MPGSRRRAPRPARRQTMKSRLDRQRAGDADALALAAGELVRVAVERIPARGRPGASARQTRARALRRGARRVDVERLGQVARDRLARVQAGVGVLEDDLHLACAALRRLAAPERLRMSRPSKRIAPASASISRRTRLAEGRFAGAGFRRRGPASRRGATLRLTSRGPASCGGRTGRGGRRNGFAEALDLDQRRASWAASAAAGASAA